MSDNTESKDYFRHLKQPYWGQIYAGEKKVEGRLLHPDKIYGQVKKGDRFCFLNDKRQELWVTITDTKRFADFDKAYEEFGARLLPTKPDDKTANEVYMDAAEYSMDDIKKYGAVALVFEKC